VLKEEEMQPPLDFFAATLEYNAKKIICQGVLPFFALFCAFVEKIV
jgi:hypothetical protein